MKRYISCVAVISVLASVCLAQSGEQETVYHAETVTNGGTISGTVKWIGSPQKDLTRPITKNADVCDPANQKNRDLERLLIESDGGVANTVVFLSNITRGKAMDLPVARQSLDQKNCRYEPHILLVPKDGNFQMKSSDTVLHNIHMVGAAVYNLPFPIKDKVITRPMHREGVVDLKCDAGHVWMNAEVLVAAHPYYTVTDAHGNFQLTNVPPGSYVVTAWHEGWKIAREETVIDVDSHQEVRRPIFSEPKTWDTNVTVAPNAAATVNFSLADK